jgi:1-deoxy-D-xylulose-5-phosphate reductoisomerase
MDLAYAAGKAGGLMPAVLNAANEQTVALFLEERVKFSDIPRIIETVCDRFTTQNISNPSLADILDADRWARQIAIEIEGELTASQRIIALK